MVVSMKDHNQYRGKQGSGGAVSPCAACKLLRRRCAPDCVFAPYFPADEPQKFANVHRVFGASNVNKMLQELPVHQRSDAVSSMVYEANARVRDPVYGCVGAISSLQQQIDTLQTQLALAQAEVVHMRMRQFATSMPRSHPSTATSSPDHNSVIPSNNNNNNNNNKLISSSGAIFTMEMEMVVDRNIDMGESLW